MKKILLALSAAVLLIFLAVLFVLPYGLGFVAQNKYAQLLAALAKSDTVQVTLINYQRGWFSSEATVKLSGLATPVTATAKTPTVVADLIIKQHLAHGPLFSLTLATGEKRLLLGQALITTRLASSYGAMDIVSWIKLNGALSGTVHAPSLIYFNALQNQHLEASGLAADFKLSAELKQFVANLHVAKMILKTGKLEQQINQLQVHYDLQKSPSGLFLGQRALTIQGMIWNLPIYPAALNFAGLHIQSQEQEQNHKINSQMSFELTQLAVNNANYGPQRLVLTINQLDIPALLALEKEMRSWRNKEDLDEVALARYRQLVIALVSKGLEVNCKQLDLVTPWGAPSLMASVVFASQPGVNPNLGEVIQGVKISANAHAPATLMIRALERFNTILATNHDNPTNIAQVPSVAPDPSQLAQQQISDWVRKGWLLPKDNGYQISVIYQNQQTIINGQAINVPQAVQSAPVPVSNNPTGKNVQRLS